MDIVFKPVSELIAYENNPRNNDKAVEPVAKSIEEFGFKVPILIDKNNVIIAGHTRLKAAKKLGMIKVPCICCDDLTPEQTNAFRIVDNRVAELSSWDWKKYSNELEVIRELEASFPVVEECFPKIDDSEIDFFLKSLENKKVDDEPTRVQCSHCGQWFDIE